MPKTSRAVEPVIREPKPTARRGKGGGGGGATLRFMREFIRHPRVLGAAFPTSRRMARAMVQDLDWSAIRSAAELGPGTGPITGAIVERLTPGTTFFAIERNHELARVFRERFPRVKLYEDDAANIRAICRREGVEQLDAVVSAIPWLVIPETARLTIMRELVASLKPGGVLSQITYFIDGLPATKKFRRLLEDHFASVSVTRRLWRNLPPGFVYHCVK
ncbi:MAG: methyltransferase domain-containing protein [Phycisphaerales bacterium]|nr:methyltransferase domain-containing protein [Phycisphaerales bacterium]